MLPLEFSSRPYLYITMTLLSFQPHSLCDLSLVSQEVSIPQPPRAGCHPQFS